MKLVIFGAGASYDCIHTFDKNVDVFGFRPPLGNDLFSLRKYFKEIRMKYPGAEALASDLSICPDIEDFFQKKWDFIQNNRADDLLAKIINVQYYLQELFFEVTNNYSEAGHSNYQILVNEAYEYSIKKKEEVCFVTFNYDTLLENTFEKLYHCKFDSIDKYIKYPIKLIKPHGSSNWYSKINGGVSLLKEPMNKIDYYLYAKKTNLLEIGKYLSNDYTILKAPYQKDNWDEEKSINFAYFPRILIPLKTKDEFVLPQNHFDYLSKYLEEVDEILIIGWKGSEQYFQELLKKKIANRKVNITTVTCGDMQVEHNLFPFLSQAKFNHFNEPFHRLTRDDNNGSFSSYILNVINNKYKSFFV